MAKRHIRNHNNRIQTKSGYIFGYRCGVIERLGDNHFTPLNSDSISFIKKHNVCMSCYKNWLGHKNYKKRLESE